MRKTRWICTFTFRNGTQIRAAVDLAGKLISFEEAFEKAKALSWIGNENYERGGLKSFDIGDPIVCD